MNIPAWVLLRAAGVPDNKHTDIVIRAQRMVEHQKPDGAQKYVPITHAYAAWRGANVLLLPTRELRTFFNGEFPTPPDDDFEIFE